MRLLIIGSFDGHIATAGKIALEKGAKVAHEESVEQAMAALRSGQGADLVMIDVRLDIRQLCVSLKSERISVPVVAFGIGAETQLAVAAIKAGAKEYIPLPPDAELIAAVLSAVTEETSSVIHRDPAMKKVLGLAAQIAPSDATVLITGESGTGKEVLARYLHSKSKRAHKAFISLNCAAIPDNLLESELFGHEKGAFTGAIGRRVGKFEEANGGTLLLDEISEMHPRLQAKLLRAIQEREVDRVGGTQTIKVDIRLLATSNRDIEEEVRKGNFREDLYFRLNVVCLELPPLRERQQDIEALADHFISKYAKANSVPAPIPSEEVRRMMLAHPWRGNVRELENSMHRAVLLSHDGIITRESIQLRGSAAAAAEGDTDLEGVAGGEDAKAAVQDPASPKDTEAPLVGRTVAAVERDLIIGTLNHTLGNRTHAATILGISIRTLRNKLKLYSQEGTPVPMPGTAERSPA